MRTTIEIPDEQRAKLLELAARRGEKGFSGLIQEALELYLRNQRQEAAVGQALKLRGQLAGDEADALEHAVRDLRSRWR